MFQLVRTAYEILKDDEERLNYDYMLENPGKTFLPGKNFLNKHSIVCDKIVINKLIAIDAHDPTILTNPEHSESTSFMLSGLGHGLYAKNYCLKEPRLCVITLQQYFLHFQMMSIVTTIATTRRE